MTKKILLLLATVLVLASLSFAQGTVVPVDEATANEIVASGVMGIGVLALTEMIKRLLKTVGVLNYVISAAVSLGATATYLLTHGGFDLVPFVTLSILVFLIANGLYKAVAQSSVGPN